MYVLTLDSFNKIRVKLFYFATFAMFSMQIWTMIGVFPVSELHEVHIILSNGNYNGLLYNKLDSF